MPQSLGILTAPLAQSSPFKLYLRSPVNPSSLGREEEKGQTRWGGESLASESSFTVKERQQIMNKIV